MSLSPAIWLRAETKPGEARSPLSPKDAKTLCEAGFAITVEESPQRVFQTREYRDSGCSIAPAGQWREAPSDCFILGLKELPEDGQALQHPHIYFAHAYKNQSGWAELLARFSAGGGHLLDLEYLLDPQGRRLAAFGYWAGFVGAGLGVLNWCRQLQGLRPGLEPLGGWDNSDSLLTACRRALAETAEHGMPRTVVIGAAGRVGSGALQLASELKLPTTGWDMAETAAGGPFPALLNHDILVNCVLVSQPMPPFLTTELIHRDSRQLRVIADVSCDPYGSYNPLPLYDRCTTLEQPCLRLVDGEPPLDLIAIDHLPSLLPRESSEDFSQQLLPALMRLAAPDAAEWIGARKLYQQHLTRME